MAIVHKVNITEALKEAGYSSYYISKNRIFGNATMQKIRTGGQLNFNDLNKICTMLQCQPGDIIAWIPDPTVGVSHDSSQN